MLFPVTGFVCEMLPESSRDSSRAELFFEDLDKLAPADVARICEWLTERVDIFSAKLKPEAKELLEVGSHLLDPAVLSGVARQVQ